MCSCLCVEWGGGPQMYGFEQIRSVHMGTPRSVRLTGTTKNITFPQHFLRAVNIMNFIPEVQKFHELIA